MFRLCVRLAVFLNNRRLLRRLIRLRRRICSSYNYLEVNLTGPIILSVRPFLTRIERTVAHQRAKQKGPPFGGPRRGMEPVGSVAAGDS